MRGLFHIEGYAQNILLKEFTPLGFESHISQKRKNGPVRQDHFSLAKECCFNKNTHIVKFRNRDTLLLF